MIKRSFFLESKPCSCDCREIWMMVLDADSNMANDGEKPCEYEDGIPLPAFYISLQPKAVIGSGKFRMALSSC